jgi:intein/homing endonuclease
MVTKRTIELSVGDYLVDEFGTEIEIFSITILEGEFTVYDLGVEDNDLYIANGVLTHNK